LVGKLGFRTDEHSVRRAGLDYWHLVDVHEHGSLDDAERWIAEADGVPRRSWLFTGKANRSYLDSDFRAGDVLVFGRESTGLDETLLAQRANQCVGIPTIGRVRSLNLSNSVAIAVYEALRQIGALTLGDSAPADPDCHTL
jgi:tRNA (cytidine/uridine-2'-O-)-methyltransferase